MRCIGEVPIQSGDKAAHLFQQSDLHGLIPYIELFLGIPDVCLQSPGTKSPLQRLLLLFSLRHVPESPH